MLEKKMNRKNPPFPLRTRRECHFINIHTYTSRYVSLIEFISPTVISLEEELGTIDVNTQKKYLKIYRSRKYSYQEVSVCGYILQHSHKVVQIQILL